MPVTLEIQGADKLFRAFQSLPDRIDAGVKVVGAPTAYALVWEWGSARIKKPGPKTTWGVNPARKRVVLTLTAPYGYIRSNRQEYLRILRQEWRVLSFAIQQADLGRLKGAMIDMAKRAATRCALIIRNAAPFDNGDLRDGIRPAYPDDPVLRAGEDTEFELPEDFL